MKRLPWMFLAAMLASASGYAAGENTARAAADRAAAEERYRILRASVDDLLAAQLELRERLNTVTETLQQVAAQARSRPSSSQFVTRAEFEKLVESVREIDRKREADRRQILNQIEHLGNSLENMLRQPTRQVVPSAPQQRGGSQEGVEYVVEKDNTLWEIIRAHNAAFKEQGRKTSLQLILDANPGLEPKTMQVGRKLFIPMVPINP
jgi:DNA anti-recombination protein RmuC